jgi:hypothetical protein
MIDWIVPGLYFLVYLDGIADGFDLVYHIDMQRPFMVCPPLTGKRWEYLRRKIRAVRSREVKQLYSLAIEKLPTNDELISTTVGKPRAGNSPDITHLIEVMTAYAFLPRGNINLGDAISVAQEQIKRVGFDVNNFHAEFLRVDFGTAGLHQYCLFGGFNHFVFRILSEQKEVFNVIEKVRRCMNTHWHEKLASYLSVILWSKVKVSPLLRATLLDDSIQARPSGARKEAEAAFQNLVIRSLTAYARNPL